MAQMLKAGVACICYSCSFRLMASDLVPFLSSHVSKPHAVPKCFSRCRVAIDDPGLQMHHIPDFRCSYEVHLDIIEQIVLARMPHSHKTPVVRPHHGRLHSKGFSCTRCANPEQRLSTFFIAHAATASSPSQAREPGL